MKKIIKIKVGTRVKTRVSCIVCPKCGDTIYSRARHDFHWCGCGEIAVDGGFDYLKMCFKTTMPKTVIKYVNVTRQDLYDDWNNRKDKYGKINVKSSK